MINYGDLIIIQLALLENGVTQRAFRIQAGLNDHRWDN
jgi:hypothetical protein